MSLRNRFHKYTLLSLLSLVSLSLHAQYNTLNEWYIGPSGGATMSTITLVPKLVDKMFTFGKNGGIVLRYISENHFGMQAEINYLESGWKEDLEGFGLHYSYCRKLNFVEIPFLLHAYSTAGNFRFMLNVGPKLGLLLSESEEIIDNSTTFIQHGKTVEKPVQYGVMGGAGLEYHLWRTVLGFEGRYCYNLSNIFSDAVGDDFNTSNLQVISLNAYLLFQIK